MVNFLDYYIFNRFIVCTTICAFSLGSSLPNFAYTIPNLNDINFAIRIEKLIEKMNRYKDKMDSNGLINVLLDIKHEVEGYTGKRIDIEKELKGIEKEVNKIGGKFKKGELKAIHDKIRKKEKRHYHKSLFMADCMNYGIDYDSELEHLNFITSSVRGDSSLEIDVPVRVTIGVTIALCGVFLFFVPLPICQQYAPRIILTGVGIAADGCMNRMEENKKRCY